VAETFWTRGADGVLIAADRRGDPGAPAVVFLHGAGQTRRSWSKAAAAVGDRGWQAITVDLRGHGESGWSEEGDYSLTSLAADVREVLRGLPGPSVLVGASLGGLTSLMLAGEVAPGAARAVVLVDIVPETQEAGLRRVLSFMADGMESGFASLEEVADAVSRYNPHRSRPTDLAGLTTNLRRDGDRWYWHWDPNFIHEFDTLAIDLADHERLYRGIERILADAVPMLLVRGQMSDLVSPENADTLLNRFPQIEFIDVRGAGHMVAGDRNDIFADAVLNFLSRHVGR
jgi:pimeloyl-ACP methyl ester carboxylesterase